MAIPLLFLIFLAHPCAGQSFYPAKETIQQLFKTSVNQESRKKITVGTDSWAACNNDSAFFISDTIVFDNSKSVTCCATVQWTFYRKDAFVQNLAQACAEPSGTAVAEIEAFYASDLIDEDASVVMRVSNRFG